MSDTRSASTCVGPGVISLVAAMSAEERRTYLDGAFERMKAAQGEIVAALGEVDRCQDYRDDGATSAESWVVERYGVSVATARGLVHVGKVAWDIPHLVGALCTGDISFDKVRAVADVATPETDQELRIQAQECSVHDLTEVARSNAAAAAATVDPSQSDHERRSLRFNDHHRTLTAQLAPDAYAEVKTALEAQARQVPSDGETPWDQRLCDVFLELIRSQVAGSSGGGGGGGGGSPFFVVAHVPLTSLVDRSGRSTALAGELDHVGLIDSETVLRIACDATVAIALDDDVGHTMYEGRARRFPTKAQRREIMRRDRHCRFPGCTNVTFANIHHIVPWEPSGPTDLDNLVLQCLHHHHLVHSDGWTMTGNANEELTILGPKGRVMTSRPSPLWTRATAGARSGTLAR
jgi:Domain of unknown function (DUF222)/HNH endonuclease